MLSLGLGLVAYGLAIAPMVYFVAFLSNLGAWRTIDRGPASAAAVAVLIDLALVASFAVAHSLLARPRAKRWVSRSVYSAIAGLQILLLMGAWRPLPGLVWLIEEPLLRGWIWTLHGVGWALVVAGGLTLRPTRLYGLATAWARFRGAEAVPDELARRGPYRWIRHPLYSGTILALWTTPEMSWGRVLLATLLTLYILIGRRLEDRDLAAAHGLQFESYRREVGAFLPRAITGKSRIRVGRG